MGKGGGGGQPTQTSSNVTNTNVPEYARPYVENMLSATQNQLFKTEGNSITGFQPYKAYGGTYDEAGNQTAYDPSKAIAGFSPMQQQAMSMANGPEGFAQNVGGYMSPYMQNVTDIQKREAARQSGIQGIQQQAQATQAGAFGGSRDAIQRAERERNLSQQMGDIQAQGSQAAFANAQNQFNTNLGQMNAAGALQQQNQQQIINQSLQDYANAQQYPLMQLGTMSNMLRGLPMQSQTTQQYQAQANPITQGIGALGAGASLYNATKAEGGVIKSMASGGITSIPRYDVGGAVISQLATMPDEALKKEAMESPSPRVREMAAAILKQRQAGLQAEPQAAEAPQGVGPMGVDYNANYAGGGIIAFAKGKEVDAEEAARYARQTEMYVLGAQQAAADRAREPQLRLRDAPETPVLRQRTVAAPPDALPPLTDAQRQAMTAGAQQAIRAGNRSGILNYVAPPPPPAPAAAPRPAPAQAPVIEAEPKASQDAGIALAKQPTDVLAARGLATIPPADAAAAAAAKTGIVETDPGRAAIADAKKLMEPFAAEAKMSTQALYEQDLAAKKALGLDNSEAKQKLMQQMMAERANLGDEANRQNWMRRAQFFAEMASTPGNTLVAGMVALKNRIPDILQDSKDQKLARQQADKAIFDLEESMRLEKLGAYDKADARRQTAIKTMAELQSHLTTASVQQGSAEKQLQGNLAQAAATVTAGQGHDAANIKHAEIMKDSAKTVADIQAAASMAHTREMAAQRAQAIADSKDNKLFAEYRATQENANRAIERAERLRSGKDYQASREAISTATMTATRPDGSVDVTKIPPALRPDYDRAIANIARFDAEIATSIKNADDAAQLAFSRLKIPAAGPTPTTGGDIRSKVEAGGQKYEPDKFEYKINADGSVQRRNK